MFSCIYIIDTFLILNICLQSLYFLAVPDVVKPFKRLGLVVSHVYLIILWAAKLSASPIRIGMVLPGRRPRCSVPELRRCPREKMVPRKSPCLEGWGFLFFLQRIH